MKRFRFFLPWVLLAGLSGTALGQAENVPVSHPVYIFLKRMEVKGLIERYHDAILPISRREVGEFLSVVNAHRQALTHAERGYLKDYLSEFQYDITRSTEGFRSLIEPAGQSFGDALADEFSNREKFLYAGADSNVSMFANVLFDLDGRRISGDALGKAHSEFVQIGGRFRGTVFGHLGYYLQGTNAQFWGSRELLLRDPELSQSHALNYVTDVQNFDFSEGYARYDAKIVSAQLGRERVLWGNGYDQKMTLSSNVRVFDFLRADVQYKALKYTFMHAWLLGTPGTVVFSLPSDSSAKFAEPVISDKYFAAHRFELSFPRLFDIGFQEMYIYSNRAPDLAYFNPFVLFESVQRSRGERDNGLWAFDIQTHFIQDIEFQATMLYDDIHIPYLFSGAWFDKYAFQVGMFYADPFAISNTSLMLEYTRVQPYVFGHERSRDDQYTSLGMILGPRIGPNADAWFIRMDYLPVRNLFFSCRVTFERKGENIVDDTGHLIKNVGGDYNQPHRDSDPQRVIFLDGNRINTVSIELRTTYEFVNQMWLDAWLQTESIENVTKGSRSENTTAGLRLRTEL